ARRRLRERQVSALPEPQVSEPDRWHDLKPLLDREIQRLPDRYRLPILLCDLEGKPRKEAARQLACSEGTLSGRLARARALLAKRLAQRGIVASGGMLGLMLAEQAAAARVPALLISSTIKAASLLAAGSGAAEGTIGATIVAL